MTWTGGTCGRCCPRLDSPCVRQGVSQVGVLVEFNGEIDENLGDGFGVEVWSGLQCQGDATTASVGLADEMMFFAVHVGVEYGLVTICDPHGFEVDAFGFPVGLARSLGNGRRRSQ